MGIHGEMCGCGDEKELIAKLEKQLAEHGLDPTEAIGIVQFKAEFEKMLDRLGRAQLLSAPTKNAILTGWIRTGLHALRLVARDKFPHAMKEVLESLGEHVEVQLVKVERRNSNAK